MKNWYPTHLLWQAFRNQQSYGTLLLLLLLAPAFASAQQTIKGRVTDDKNTALPSATVRLKDSTQGTTSAADGTYSLATTGPADIPVFSFVGTVG